MTYHEIADMIGCDVETARSATIQRALDRKKSRDGMTRAKLDPELMGVFVAVIRNAEPDLDLAVRELRNMHQAMLRNEVNSPGRSAAG
ncbi:hypothetical protein [Bradyrhizobium sp. LTSPM299]|uniref:hypothetical protein n=1 Tax=Bradyrhizobium sp. LTSPM299 TaxID=1619233 RepID=UPI001FDABD6E|nr:hypothetical protein [Bradyrhizobium sp. LTSPM299]